MGEGGGGTDYETRGGGGGGHEIEGEEGWDGDGGSPCLARAASTDEELTDRQRGAGRDEKERDNAEVRGGRSLRDVGEFRSRGARRGNDDTGIRNLFIVENIIQCQDFPLVC
jgi:hypothetical protein